MSEEAAALAATLRACAREGEDYEAITRAGLRAAALLERQAAQLSALRTGADTEDLHAAAAKLNDGAIVKMIGRPPLAEVHHLPEAIELIDAVRKAGAMLLATWEAWRDPASREARNALVLASSFADQAATDMGGCGTDEAPIAALDAFLRALADPMAPALDRLRARNRTETTDTDRIARLEAEAETLHAAAEGWRKRAQAAETLVAECEPCLREGETPRQRIDRERADVDAVGKLYYREKAKAENARRQALEDAANECDRIAVGKDAVVLRHCSGAEKCSAAIRALADKSAAGGADA